LTAGRLSSPVDSNIGWVAERFKAPVLKCGGIHPAQSLPFPKGLDLSGFF